MPKRYNYDADFENVTVDNDPLMVGAVSDTDPGLTRPGIWVQTGLGGGDDFTIWIEDGV